MILAIDPGREKCGLAVLDDNAKVHEKTICSKSEILNIISPLLLRYKINLVVMGDSTGAKDIKRELLRSDYKIHLVFVPEKNSTYLARKRYFLDNPPSGIKRFIPTSLLVPPVPIDDYAAVILGERYLKG